MDGDHGELAEDDRRQVGAVQAVDGVDVAGHDLGVLAAVDVDDVVLAEGDDVVLGAEDDRRVGQRLGRAAAC